MQVKDEQPLTQVVVGTIADLFSRAPRFHRERSIGVANETDVSGTFDDGRVAGEHDLFRSVEVFAQGASPAHARSTALA